MAHELRTAEQIAEEIRLRAQEFVDADGDDEIVHTPSITRLRTPDANGAHWTIGMIRAPGVAYVERVAETLKKTWDLKP